MGVGGDEGSSRSLCRFFLPPLSSVFNATVASFPNGTALQSLRFHVPLQVHSLSSLSSLFRITVKSVLLPFSADANPFFGGGVVLMQLKTDLEPRNFYFF